jgi:hypothetical protein
MGFGRPARWAGRDEGRAFGLVPVKKDFFRNYFSKRKQFQEILENVLKHEKYSENHKKNPGKFPETDWDTNNPNKVFGAHEKDCRAF